MIGRFVELAGGENILADRIPGVISQISVEQLLVDQPDIYVTTAIGGATMTAEQNVGRIILGTYADAETSRASLAKSMERTGLPELDAIKNGKVYSAWHHFYNTPMNVTLLQAMAKWFHPDHFADLDPDATLAEFFDRFQPVALNGVYWIGLDRP
jgi:iron complex transport system substrate-binding protein